MLKVLVLGIHFFKHGLYGELGASTTAQLLKTYLSLLKFLGKCLLTWHQKHECVSLGLVPSSTTDSVNIGIYILRNIDLNDPVDCWEIYSSRCNISTKQNCLLFFNKLEIDSCAFVLVLFPM